VEWLAGKASLAKKIAGLQHRNHAFLALLRDDRQPHFASLDIEDRVGGIALPEDDPTFLVADGGATGPERGEHRTSVEVLTLSGFRVLAILPGSAGFRSGHGNSETAVLSEISDASPKGNPPRCAILNRYVAQRLLVDR
jgi:hypothetical protein